jgi:UDP-N-acetylglucosamine--N-acetylmuramyl-(pentapeptide) pyrophosphoryl-undecaprenol N-acetylglucosamine transferase
LIAGGGTGGHLMPALALARVATDAGHEVVLVGAARGIEARVLPRHPFRFHLLPIEPLYRRQWWRNLLLPLMWLRATRSSERVLRDEQPQLVIGTGATRRVPSFLRAARRDSDRASGAERVSGDHDAMAGAARATDSSGISGSA